jgi:hypothetical protein
MEDFQETRINHKNIINVPAEAIKPGYASLLVYSHNCLYINCKTIFSSLDIKVAAILRVISAIKKILGKS